VLVMDNAGWHHARALKMPANVTPLYLPPYSPELNPIERLWGYLKSHHLSNRAYETYEDLLEAGADAWNRLTKQVIASVCATSWLMPEIQA
jgi:transposase